MTRSSGSGLRPAVLAALTGACLAGAAAWVLVPETPSGPDAAQSSGEGNQSVDSRWAFQPIEVTDPLIRGLAITTVLASREGAVLEGRRAAFDKHVMPQMAKADGVRWNVLSALPLKEWKYRLTGAATLSLEGDVPVLRQQATIFWRTEGSTAKPAAAPVQLSFQHRGGRWLLASESPIGGRTPIWEAAGSARVASSPLATVITLGGRGPNPRAAADPGLWLGDMEAAVRRLRDDFPQDAEDSGPVIAVVPADTDQLAAILGRERSTLDGLGAISMDESAGYWEIKTSAQPSPTSSERETSGIAVADRPASQIIWINRDPWLGLNPRGRSIISRHEVFHLLADAPSTGQVPLWFEEAAAEWVGYAESGVPREAILKHLSADAAVGTFPTDFPAEADFTGPTLEKAYEGAWLAADLIVDRVGRAGLMKVYATAAAGTATEPKDNLDAALRAELGMSLSEFKSLWRDSIR